MKIVESFEHIEESNTIEVVYRETSNMMLLTNPPQRAPDRVWKEIYGVDDGEIKQIKIIKANYTPATEAKYTF